VKPVKMYRRRWSVVHGRDGFALYVRDCWLPGILAEHVTGAFLAALGHPCCGRGIGRIPSDHFDIMWFTVLNWPCRFAVRDRMVIDLPLTVEQALTLAPSWAGDFMMVDGTDEYGYTWQDAVMVGTPYDD